MTTPILHVEHLKKSFRVPNPQHGRLGAVRQFIKPKYEMKVAIEDVSFTVHPGEFVAYLGPNGAGKSTTIKCLTGVMVPDGGLVRACNTVPWEDRMKYTRQIGVVFGQKSLLIWDLLVRDSLRLYKDVYRISDEDYRLRVDELTSRFNAQALLDTPTRKLSLGQRMRCELIAALLHRPQVLFLDEPTIGLDYAARHQFREVLRDMHREWGMTVLFTSHDLTEVEALCQRLLIIERGKVSFDGPLETLRRSTPLPHQLSISFQEVHQPTILQRLIAMYEGNIKNNELTLHVKAEEVPPLIAELSQVLQITALNINKPSLDRVLAHRYTL